MSFYKKEMGLSMEVNRNDKKSYPECYPGMKKPALSWLLHFVTH
jgi:hypothetical protein